MTIDIINGFLFYGILSIITAIFASFSVNKTIGQSRIIFGILAVLLPTFFAGIRYGIGTDYFNYLSTFNKINNLGIINANKEFIYAVINRLVGILELNYNTVLFITSFITNLFVYLSLIKYKEDLNIGLGMFIYMLTYYQMSFNAVRQIAALAILLYSIKYIQERKFIRFTIWVVVAMGFHITAVLFFPLYFLNFLYGTSKHKILRILSFVILALIMIDFSNILFPIFSKFESLSYYVNSYLHSRGEFELRIGYFIRTLPLVVPSIMLWNNVKESSRMMLYSNNLIIGCITLLTAYSSTNLTERISYYFMSSQIIVIPYIYKKYSKNKKVYIGVLVVLAVIALWAWDFIYKGRNGTIPYNWIL